MKRREFLIATAMLATAMRQAMAQQPAKMKRVAMLNPSTRIDDIRIGGNEPGYTILFEEMKRLGYVDGNNLIVDRYSAEGQADRYPEIARNVVAARPDVIFAITNSLTLALQSETRTIPIVAWTSDPSRRVAFYRHSLSLIPFSAAKPAPGRRSIGRRTRSVATVMRECMSIDWYRLANAALSTLTRADIAAALGGAPANDAIFASPQPSFAHRGPHG